jgi:hypothetical protein
VGGDSRRLYYSNCPSCAYRYIFADDGRLGIYCVFWFPIWQTSVGRLIRRFYYPLTFFPPLSGQQNEKKKHFLLLLLLLPTVISLWVLWSLCNGTWSLRLSFFNATTKHHHHCPSSSSPSHLGDQEGGHFIWYVLACFVDSKEPQRIGAKKNCPRDSLLDVYGLFFSCGRWVDGEGRYGEDTRKSR